MKIPANMVEHFANHMKRVNELERDLAHQRELVRVLVEGWRNFCLECGKDADSYKDILAWAEFKIKARAGEGKHE